MDEDDVLAAMVDAAVDEKAVLHEVTDERFDLAEAYMAQYFEAILEKFPNANRQAMDRALNQLATARAHIHSGIANGTLVRIPALDFDVEE